MDREVWLFPGRWVVDDTNCTDNMRCDLSHIQISPWVIYFDTRGHSYPNKMKLREHSVTSCCGDLNMVNNYSWFPQEAPEFTSRQALALWRNKYHYLSTHLLKPTSKYKVANVFDKYFAEKKVNYYIQVLKMAPTPPPLKVREVYLFYFTS